ncbi:hypothetical protein LTR37_013261 [Vermiconidia calcicola]|uniref:Uncharacterized protein n=1 Tax=Vermiconidia calcicola TaxID=1690605 RepID=A0ACC3MX29_9PEZI|nr:hypothetical protein LTR37_013261 [Vermiconidia calcicola]
MATLTETRTAPPTISVADRPLTLTIKPIAPFAAELTGLDFSKPVSGSLLKEINDIFATYGVVIVRKNGPTTDDQLIQFARHFGELDSVSQHRKQGIGCRVPQDEIFDVGNLNGDNEIIDLSKDPGKVASGNGNSLWHADGSFNPRRTSLSMLRAVELPPKGTGGETEFLDCRAAYADLSEEMKNKIDGLVAFHSLVHNRKVANPDSPLFKDLEVLKSPLVKHKVAQIHEPSGRPTLYVTSYTHHIDGMDLEEGIELVKELFQHVQQDKYKITHHWEEPGDLVIWDNTSVLHRATHGAYEGKYRRDMRRVSVFDPSSYGFGLNSKEDYWKQALP